MTIVTWLLSRVQVDPEGCVETNQLYNAYEFEMKEKGIYSKCNPRIFSQHILEIYPSATRKLIKTRTKTITKYIGLQLEKLSENCEQSSNNIKDIKQYIPSNCQIIEDSFNLVKCSIDSQKISNGNRIEKIIKFLPNGIWEVEVGGKNIDLESMFIENQYKINQESIKTVIKAVDCIRLCEGIKVTKSVVVTRFHTLEKWSEIGTVPERKIRSVMCKRSIAFHLPSSACRTCRTMTFSKPSNDKITTGNEDKNEKENVTESVSKPKTMTTREQIVKVIPGATDEMVELLLSQADNAQRNPTGRRWSQSIIKTCLQWYCKSPHTYESFRSGHHLVLPSRSTLIAYKNRVKQESGLEESNLEWMREEAKRRDLPVEGYMGGLVLDEMSIQTDIQIAKNGDVIELVGLTDVGSEGNISEVLRTGKNERTLGSHVLQLVFIGLTGFRFPFAHYVTTGAQAPQLYTLFWEAVRKLRRYGFRVLYTCMDGAQSNRSFMKVHVGEDSKSFTAQSLCLFSDMIFMMDPSHVFKKVRNNIIKSGLENKSTRLVTLPSGYTVHWQMFTDSYEWDKQQAFQIHRKLTNEHFYLNNHSKMRNHLAEEVLDTDMLYLMKQFQRQLGEKGSILNGVIELLEKTSKFISIFRDMRPIKSVQDERLNDLAVIAKWFDYWKCHSRSNAKPKEKPTMMSLQCHEDVQSCIVGFITLCHVVLGMYKSNIYITPGLVNSDIVENTFNQQRSTYHGANANPNALQYQRALNSIILGQNTVSTKANCGKVRDAALPYNCNKPKPKLKRKSEKGTETKLKVIRL